MLHRLRSAFHRFHGIVRSAAVASLANDDVRLWMGRRRFKKYQQNLKISAPSGSGSVRNAATYNAKALNNLAIDFYMRRMKWLIFSTLAVETTTPTSKFLVVGPRTENEILYLKALGYPNVAGLDLISYSPWVTLGDMHHIPFANESFDVLLCGWTLPYSKTPEVVAKEMLRVTKPLGLIAIGLEHIPGASLVKMMADAADSGQADLDPKEIARDRINTVQDVLAVFGEKNVREVVFRHDAPLRDTPPLQIEKISGLASSQVMVTFRRC